MLFYDGDCPFCTLYSFNHTVRTVDIVYTMLAFLSCDMGNLIEPHMNNINKMHTIAQPQFMQNKNRLIEPHTPLRHHVTCLLLLSLL